MPGPQDEEAGPREDRRGDAGGHYALYPHMSVADNMAFALKIAGKDKADIKQRIDEAAKVLDLTDYLDRKPKALSGGQRQRVATGRGGWASRPSTSPTT